MNADFIIIGGGIAGLSAGGRLSEHGKVLVLEAEHAVGYHASGRSAAMFEENYGNRSTVALSRASATYHETHNGGYLTPRGLLLVAGEAQKAAYEADLDELSLHPVSLDQALDMVPILNPDAVQFAAHHVHARDLDTDRMMQDFAKQIRQGGGQVLTRHVVSGIERLDGKGWRVLVGDQSFEAPILVNAAGPWVDEIAAMAGMAPIGIQPKRRSMARLPAPGGLDVSAWPMLMGVGESWYAKPDAGKLLVSPADAEPTTPHDAYADDMVLAEGLARYEAMVTEPVTRVETNWAGLRSFVADKALVLGPDPADRSFVWSAAQGGYGFQTAPAASRLVADLVTGATPELDAVTLADLSPERLR